MKRRKSKDHIDVGERQEKEESYKTTSSVNANLRAHLSDNFASLASFDSKPKRERSDSNDGFTLPDLPCDDENRDL